MIPLGLKETKELDLLVPLKVSIRVLHTQCKEGERPCTLGTVGCCRGDAAAAAKHFLFWNSCKKISLWGRAGLKTWESGRWGCGDVGEQKPGRGELGFPWHRFPCRESLHIQNRPKSPLNLEYLFPRVNWGCLFYCFPIQDLISEHYGEDGILFEKEIKEFMELRQVSVPRFAKSCFGLSRNTHWRCCIFFWGPPVLPPNLTLVFVSRGAGLPQLWLIGYKILQTIQ